MDFNAMRPLLEKQIAILPGSRDARGSSLLVFPSPGDWVQHPYDSVLAVVHYLLNTIDDETRRRRGVTVLVDMRRAWIRHLKTVLRALQAAAVHELRQVVVVKPTQFLEKQRIMVDIMLDAYDFKIEMVSVHKLSRFVDLAALPQSLGGTYPYSHERWLQLRERYESLLMDANALLRSVRRAARERGQVKLSNKGDSGVGSQRALDGNQTRVSAPPDSLPDAEQIEEFKKRGEQLIDELSHGKVDELVDIKQTVNPDHLKQAERIGTVIKQLQDLHNSALGIPTQEELAAAAAEMDKKLYEQYSEGVDNIMSWLMDAGEKWLLTLHEIGESTDEARQLAKDHETLRVKADEIAAQVQDLSGIAEKLCEGENSNSPWARAVRKRSEQLDNASGTFTARIKRQAAIVDMSVHFHQLLAELSKQMDELLDVLCSEVQAGTAAEAEKLLQQLDAQIELIDKNHEELLNSGRQLLEQLSATEFNALGQEITRDYLVPVPDPVKSPVKCQMSCNVSKVMENALENGKRTVWDCPPAGVVHVRRALADAVTRRKRAADMVDVRRLKLQQLLQLFTCENDCEQAIAWVDELSHVLDVDFADAPGSKEELIQLKADQFKLETTARSTYDYGRQLTQVSLVLRRSLRLEVGPQLTLTRRLEAIWAQFCRALSESTARLSISHAFHSTAKEVSSRLQNLCDSLQSGDAVTTTAAANGHSSSTSSTNGVDPPEAASPHRPTSRATPDSDAGVQRTRRQLDGDVRELRHMANVLQRGAQPRHPAAEGGDEGAAATESGTQQRTQIKHLLADIENKQRKLDELVSRRAGDSA